MRSLRALIVRAVDLGYDAVIAERFWSGVDIAPSGCWEWQRARHSSGYGRAHFGGRQEQAHRVAYLLSVGEIPSGRILCHRCANKPCSRPSHLFAGTHCWNAPLRQADGYVYTFQGPGARPLFARTGIVLPGGRIGPLPLDEKTSAPIADAFDQLVRERKAG